MINIQYRISNIELEIRKYRMGYLTRIFRNLIFGRLPQWNSYNSRRQNLIRS